MNDLLTLAIAHVEAAMEGASDRRLALTTAGVLIETVLDAEKMTLDLARGDEPQEREQESDTDETERSSIGLARRRAQWKHEVRLALKSATDAHPRGQAGWGVDHGRSGSTINRVVNNRSGSNALYADISKRLGIPVPPGVV